MKRERLRELVDAYGTDPAGFPEAEREAARAVLPACAEENWFKNARWLDEELGVLSNLERNAPEPRLAGRISDAWLKERAATDVPENVVKLHARERSPRPRRRHARRLDGKQRALTGLFFAAAAAFGLWLGANEDPAASEDVAAQQDDFETTAAAFGVDLEWAQE